MRLVIQGCPITKKNSQRIVLIGGHPKIIPSKQYKIYEDAALYQMSTKRPSEPIRDPVNVGCVYYMPTRRRVDLVNLLEATMDILVKAKILEDDNANIVAGPRRGRQSWTTGLILPGMRPAAQSWTALWNE